MRTLFVLLLLGGAFAAQGCKCESTPPAAKDSVEDKEMEDGVEAEAEDEAEGEDNENE